MSELHYLSATQAIASFREAIVTSGRPGTRLSCSRYRRPADQSARRTASSGFVLPDRTRAMTSDLVIGGLLVGLVLLGGFDLVPEVLEQMKAGYVQVQIDQQPYEQGFLPVMEVYLAKTVGLSPADVDTGQGVVTPDMVDSIMDLSKQGVR